MPTWKTEKDHPKEFIIKVTNRWRRLERSLGLNKGDIPRGMRDLEFCLPVGKSARPKR